MDVSEVFSYFFKNPYGVLDGHVLLFYFWFVIDVKSSFCSKVYLDSVYDVSELSTNYYFASYSLNYD